MKYILATLGIVLAAAGIIIAASYGGGYVFGGIVFAGVIAGGIYLYRYLVEKDRCENQKKK